METREKRDAEIRKEALIAGLLVGALLACFLGIQIWVYNAGPVTPTYWTFPTTFIGICIIVLAVIGTYRFSSLSQQMRDLRERLDKKVG